MTDFIRYGQNVVIGKNDRFVRGRPIDDKSAPCEPTDRDGIGAVWGDIDLSEIGAVCEAPEWYLYCTINCWCHRSQLDPDMTPLPLEFLDPDGICSIGAANDEIGAIRLFSEHVKQFGHQHRPYMYMLPTYVMDFHQWLATCWGDPLGYGEYRSTSQQDYLNYIVENQDVVRVYLAEIETTSIFRVPVDHRR